MTLTTKTNISGILEKGMKQEIVEIQQQINTILDYKILWVLVFTFLPLLTFMFKNLMVPRRIRVGGWKTFFTAILERLSMVAIACLDSDKHCQSQALAASLVNNLRLLL